MSMATSSRRLEHISRSADWIDRAAAIMNKTCSGVAAACVAYVFLVLVAGVLFRPWSGFVFSFAFETSVAMLWPISFLALSELWRTQGHMRFDLLLRITRFRWHHSLLLCGSIGAFGMSIALAWAGATSLFAEYRSGSATLAFQYPIWPFYSSAAIGTFALALELLASIVRDIREIASPTGSEERIYGVFYDDGTKGV